MLQLHGSKRSAIGSLVLVALCATLFSFSEKIGSDSFTIYLNDKLMIQQFITPETNVKSITLDVSDANDVLKIHYSHCGQIGVNRSISIQDRKEKVLKTWQFPDSNFPGIGFKVNELLAAAKNIQDKDLRLVYSSRELPKGKVLAAIIVSDESKASLK